MAWIKLDDRMAEHPKLIAAGPLASYLHICAIQYANRNRTDGFIPARAIYTLIDLGGYGVVRGVYGKDADPDYSEIHAIELADALVTGGLWERVPNGYQVHDYLEYQSSAAEIDQYRAKDRARKQPPPLEESDGSTNGIHTESARIPETSARIPPRKTETKTKTENENVEVPFSAENGRAAPAATPPLKVPKPNRLAQVIDLIRDADLEPNVRGQDTRAVKDCRASPADIAATYVAIARDEFGDNFTGLKLSIATACAHVDGWRARQQRQLHHRPPDGFLGASPRAHVTRTRGGIFG